MVILRGRRRKRCEAAHRAVASRTNYWLSEKRPKMRAPSNSCAGPFFNTFNTCVYDVPPRPSFGSFDADFSPAILSRSDRFSSKARLQPFREPTSWRTNVSGPMASVTSSQYRSCSVGCSIESRAGFTDGYWLDWRAGGRPPSDFSENRRARFFVLRRGPVMRRESLRTPSP